MVYLCHRLLGCSEKHKNCLCISQVSLQFVSQVSLQLHMGLPLQFCCDLQIYSELNLHQRKPWQRRSCRHAQKACYKVFATLQMSWQKKYFRNLERHSLKNDRCLIIAHKLETFIWNNYKLIALINLYNGCSLSCIFEPFYTWSITFLWGKVRLPPPHFQWTVLDVFHPELPRSQVIQMYVFKMKHYLVKGVQLHRQKFVSST